MGQFSVTSVAVGRYDTSAGYVHSQSERSTQSIPPFLPRLVRGSTGPDSLTERIQAFVTGNLGNGVRLKEVASFLGYSEKYSSEVFQLHMGTCFSHYLKHLRILKAKDMLAAENVSMTQIAEVLGFSDSFAFSHFFKRIVGCSPTAFRKQQLQCAGLE